MRGIVDANNIRSLNTEVLFRFSLRSNGEFRIPFYGSDRIHSVNDPFLIFFVRNCNFKCH